MQKQKKRHRYVNKSSHKNQTLTSFGGIYFIEDEYFRLFADSIDHVWGLSSKLYSYQYSEILRALTMVYFCGGDYLEDISKQAGVLHLRPDARILSSDMIDRGLKELVCPMCGKMTLETDVAEDESTPLLFEMNDRYPKDKAKAKCHLAISGCLQ